MLTSPQDIVLLVKGETNLSVHTWFNRLCLCSIKWNATRNATDIWRQGRSYPAVGGLDLDTYAEGTEVWFLIVACTTSRDYQRFSTCDDACTDHDFGQRAQNLGVRSGSVRRCRDRQIHKRHGDEIPSNAQLNVHI